MTVTAQPVPILSDNYAWMLRDSGSGAVAIVDPADAKPIIAALEKAGGRLDLILLTHHHSDHIAGVDEVRAHFKDAKVVDGFIGALPEAQVRAFVDRLAPAPTEADLLVAKGDEDSLRRALDLVPDHAGAIEGLARVLIDRGEAAEALAVLGRIPETETTRALAADARLLEAGVDVSDAGRDEIAGKLDELLGRVRDDDAARQEFVDLLEAMGADDPRTKDYRRALAARLF